jgi:hypothetical protein
MSVLFIFQKYKHLFYTFACLVFVLTCCDDDNVEEKKQLTALHGLWTLQQGYRNDNLTETLDGVYFVFDSVGKMQTNLPVVPDSFLTVQIKNKEIIQQTGKKQQVSYQIDSMTPNLLILSTASGGVRLKMELIRQ